MEQKRLVFRRLMTYDLGPQIPTYTLLGMKKRPLQTLIENINLPDDERITRFKTYLAEENHHDLLEKRSNAHTERILQAHHMPGEPLFMTAEEFSKKIETLTTP